MTNVASDYVTAKAQLYLTTGRVLLLEVGPHRVLASVDGTGDDPYVVVWTRTSGWQCDCPAYGPCAHLQAVQTVTVANPDRGSICDGFGHGPAGDGLAEIARQRGGTPGGPA